MLTLSLTLSLSLSHGDGHGASGEGTRARSKERGRLPLIGGAYITLLLELTLLRVGKDAAEGEDGIEQRPEPGVVATTAAGGGSMWRVVIDSIQLGVEGRLMDESHEGTPVVERAGGEGPGDVLGREGGGSGPRLVGAREIGASGGELIYDGRHDEGCRRVSGTDETAVLPFDAADEAQTGGMAVIIPEAAIVEVQLTGALDHGLHHRIGLDGIRVETSIVQIDVGQGGLDDGLGSLQAMLQLLDIMLRSRFPSSIRWLIVRTP